VLRERVFLEVAEPLLPAIVDRIINDPQLYREVGIYDHLAIVLPSRRASRRLLDLLVTRMAAQGRAAIVPPTFLTLGTFFETLYHPLLPAADEGIALVAWAAALKELSPEALQTLFPMSVQLEGRQLLGVAQSVQQVWTQITAGGHRFSTVAPRVDEFPGLEGDERWSVLALLEESYLNKLAQSGYSDLQVNRISARSDTQLSVNTNLTYMLCGLSELSTLAKSFLSESSAPVIPYVYASAQQAHLFDAFGCVIPERWREQEIRIPQQALSIVRGTEEEVQQIKLILHGLNSRFSGDEITLGLGNEALVPVITSHLSESGVAARYAEGTPYTATAAFGVLEALSRFAKTKRYEEFAVLLRHPWISGWITKNQEAFTTRDPVVVSDMYYRMHLPDQILHLAAPRDEISTLFLQLRDLLLTLAGRLSGEDSLYEQMRTLLGELHPEGEAYYSSDEFLLLERSFDTCALIPQQLLAEVELDAHEMLYEVLKKAVIPQEVVPHAIELVGWLELLADDAPVLMVTGLNEEYIPDAVLGDPFLPDGLRHHLKLLTNEGRYARDAYLLATLLTRSQIHLIARRERDDGSPLLLSRLLLADAPEIVATRLEQFYEPEDSASPHTVPPSTAWHLPKPEPVTETTVIIPVTSIRTYLDCPYLYYLKRVRRLQEIDDSDHELSRPLYGTLVHEVLQRFSASPHVNVLREDVVYDALLQQLDYVTKARFGDRPRPVVLLQGDFLKKRLEYLAQKHVAWLNDGWRVHHAEYQLSDAFSEIEVGSTIVRFRGRIDRIDRHESGRFAIIDYKTGGASMTPHEAYIEREERWIDPQLPLYYHLLRREGRVFGMETQPEEVSLCYFRISADPDATGIIPATWTADVINRAWEASCAVAADIVAQKFWPPRPPESLNEELALFRGYGQREVVWE
jgi:ATP-dependent helicase/nuclease subunit B